MASKEHIRKIGKNVSNVLAAGAVLYGGIQLMENRGPSNEPSRQIAYSGQVLTEAEIAALRNYENWIAQSTNATQTQNETSGKREFGISSVENAQPPKPAVEITADQKAQITKYESELSDIIAKLNPTQQEQADLKIYYPIYRAAQDRFGTPWYLTWIVHEAESTASQNPNAFIQGATHFGAMQRSVQYHPQEDADRAGAGFEYLATLDVRNPTDIKEIPWGASALAEYIQRAGSILGGLELYSAAAPAQARYQKFLLIKSKLGN